MREFFFDGFKRLDWGFGNPNITAALIATLMMAIWILAYFHRHGFWPALAGFAALGVFLLQTVSRGGVVAAIAGGGVLVFFASRPWPKSRWIPIVVCIAGLAAYAASIGIGARYSQGIVEKDGSITNRLIIYRSVPQMIIDAPAGWGLKRSPEAFHNFYQPEGRLERYGSLVSSHFSWLAEFSWLNRIGYLFAWLTVLILCWPSAKVRWYSVALATWTAFGGAASFSTIASRWPIWITPVLILLAVLISRLIRKDWPASKSWTIPALGTASMVLSVVLCSVLSSRPVSIRLSNGIVSMGKRGEGRTVWLAAPEAEILGQAFGQRIRKSIREDPSETRSQRFAIEWESTDLAPAPDDWVMAMSDGIKTIEGNRMKSLSQAAQWVFFNPGEPSKELFESLDQMPPIRVIWGEFNPGQNRLIWQALAKKFNNVSFETAEAAGKYLPDWMDYLIEDPPNTRDSGSNELEDETAN